MEAVIEFVFSHALYAHWIVFGALLLAGLNIPISEDLLIIFSGVLAATVVPEHLVQLFLGVFLGCYFSDWICYWMGRKLGPKLWDFKWFARAVNRDRLDQVHAYFAKYGFWTLLVGRFIPFGVRNCLFLAAGAGQMPFRRFILSDGIACFTSNSVLFSVAYFAGKNHEVLFSSLKTVNILIFSVFIVSIIGLIWYKRKVIFRGKNRSPE